MLSIWRNRPLVITIIVVIILVVLLIITAGDNNMSGTESVVGSIMAPVQSALYSGADAIADFFSRMFSGADIRAENADLSARVEELEGQLMEYNDMKRENERLKELLNYAEQTQELEFVTAKVIGSSFGHWLNTIIINVGIKDGITADMPIVNNDGLIGRVIATGYNWSRVMAIVNADSNVSAIVERTRDMGILSGTVSTGLEEEALLTMSFLPFDADLVPGDTTITSSHAGVFPKGIAIGEVIDVSKSDDGMKNEAIIAPYVDFYHLEEVMVITSSPIDIEEVLP